jgi:5-methyltetrahydropteroyltriglutamate--homocysteine methyltransferase
MKVGGLVRWFDNNTFYRQPVIHGSVGWRPGLISSYVYSDLLREVQNPKVVLPSPFTFARLCHNNHYRSDEALVRALGEVLGEAARELVAAGIKHVQFSEPVAVTRKLGKDEKLLAKDGLAVATNGLSCDTSVHTFFGDLSFVYPDILDWPVTSIGADFYASNLDFLSEFRCTKPLIAGCADSRNSLLEEAEEIAGFALEVSKRMEPPHLVLAPNCDLEFLPRLVAEQKLRRLRNAREILEGRS